MCYVYITQKQRIYSSSPYELCLFRDYATPRIIPRELRLTDLRRGAVRTLPGERRLQIQQVTSPVMASAEVSGLFVTSIPDRPIRSVAYG
jgi:hypothetical protein